jgi:hypothetical protein
VRSPISKLYAATNKVRKATGKRSGLEVKIASHLVENNVEFDDEKGIEAVPYQSRREKKYHPDFRLKNGIIIEAKGWFKPADREKHLCIKYQHPELDIRFVFSNPKAKLGKGSPTTYGMWCVKYGFKFAKGCVPIEWIEEQKPRVKPALVWDKKDFNPNCPHTETFMDYTAGDAAYWTVCWACGAVVDGGMAGHN